jgi:hypothetical protein
MVIMIKLREWQGDRKIKRSEERILPGKEI